MELKLPFGLKDGSLVEISQVERGLACGCVCPACSHRLIARKGERTAHHFAHYKSAECVNALETTLHLAAKDIFEKNKRIRLPAVFAQINSSFLSSVQLYDEQIIEFENVLLEKRLDDVVPDIVIESRGKRLLVEIAVTHFIDEYKKEKLNKLEVSTIEVDLSHLSRQISFAKLEEILIYHVETKRWIYNTKVTAFRELISKLGKEHAVVLRGNSSHIDDCPLNARFWKGKPYANFYGDCINCEYFFESRGDGRSLLSHITCLGHAKQKFAQIVGGYNK